MNAVIVRWAQGGTGYRVHLLSFWIILYFFFNSVGLPHGLLYTTILCPFFYMWLYQKGQRWIISKFLVFFTPFILMHLILGVTDNFMYSRSLILFMSVYITIYAAAIALRSTSNLDKIFNQIILINLAFVFLAILLFKTPYADLMWTTGSFTKGISDVSRLRMLTYEPSYYATLLVPFIVYAIVSFISNPSKNSFILIIFIIIPLILSLSFGVISSLTIAISIVTVYKNSQITRKPIVLFFVFVSIASAVVLLNTDNLITQRLYNLLAGIDSSAKNRIFESTDIGYQVAKSTNIFVGSGFGQSKFFLPYLFDVYWKGLEIYRLTNAFADTLAALGIGGVLLRFGAEIILFFRTRVYTNYFRFVLFLFAFVYQFTGSYITNVAEYIIWMLAFYPVFPEMNVYSARKKLL